MIEQVNPTRECFSRQLGQKRPDPYAWHTSAADEAARERALREMFDAENRGTEPLSWRIANWIILVIFAGVLVATLLGKL